MLMSMKYFVYVIECCQSKKRYTGLSRDPQKRLVEHNSGKSKFTSGYGPWRVVYTELAGELPAARQREKYLKTASGRKWLGRHVRDVEAGGSLPA